MEGRRIVELAHDIQTGLGQIDVPDFDQMRVMGMASTLVIPIRGESPRFFRRLFRLSQAASV